MVDVMAELKTAADRQDGKWTAELVAEMPEVVAEEFNRVLAERDGYIARIREMLAHMEWGTHFIILHSDPGIASNWRCRHCGRQGTEYKPDPIEHAPDCPGAQFWAAAVGECQLPFGDTIENRPDALSKAPQ